MMSPVAARWGVHRRESVPGHGLRKRDIHYTGGCGLSLPSNEWIICPFSESQRRAEQSEEAVTSCCALGNQSQLITGAVCVYEQKLHKCGFRGPCGHSM